MLLLNVQVTKTPMYLKQIGQIGLHNVGNVEGKAKYAVFLDGIKVADITHRRSDGAVALMSKTLLMLEGQGYKLDE